MDITGIGSVADLIKDGLDRIFPDPAQRADATLKLAQLQQQGAFKDIDAQLATMQAQTDVNKVEAASPSLFVCGWRPAVGWIGALGLAYQWLLVPLTSYVYTTYTGHELPVVPPIMDPNLLLLIGSLLGINISARSYEKIKGVASN